MSNLSGITELEAIRHDLRNVLTSLRHGCTLIGYELDRTEHEEAHSILDEMHRSIEQGHSIVESLRDVEHNAEAVAQASVPQNGNP